MKQLILWVIMAFVVLSGPTAGSNNHDNEPLTQVDAVDEIETSIPSTTPIEIVETYAQAVMARDGVMQFDLFDDELKESTRENFTALNWVTGVSSPWITGFDINQINDLEFEIVFHYATSTGPCNDEAVKLLLCRINEEYKISEIK